MSDAVQLALIAALSAGWHDFTTNAAAVAAAFGTIGTFVYQIWTKHEAKNGRAAVVKALAANDAKTDTLAASLGVDTTAPAQLGTVTTNVSSDQTQPIQAKR